ncbi:hypothetical protein G4L39_00320 [Limisphaera ngatamarikiensis]|uniref:Uncharacterized protein n=1 Tax=Limisphaera ngatamarikiensis TaxID=1324935 RepID=A0A6M1RXE5_9BACT|nr:hypothetical protein [Limisphaera ngatamarikiensis]NGO37850.1 hypothetical protein [Limisphaera ngatamarikiensis]
MVAAQKQSTPGGLPALEALPRSAWSPATQTRWRDGVEVTEQYAGIRHTVAGSDFTFLLAVARWKKDDQMFWRYAFVAHDPRRTDAEAVMARHRLKGAKEQLFKEVLRGLDLHHPPCANGLLPWAAPRPTLDPDCSHGRGIFP